MNAAAHLQWLVEDGYLEVEGVEGESLELMMAKYACMNDQALEAFRNEEGIIEGVKGFRLVRQRRAPGSHPPFEADPMNHPWQCVEVCPCPRQLLSSPQRRSELAVSYESPVFLLKQSGCCS
jgi:hypothetical protein